MLRSLQEIMRGNTEHALHHLWSEELSDAEAAAIHNRAQGDPKYREELDGSLDVLAGMEALSEDCDILEIAWDYPRLLRERWLQRRRELSIAACVLALIGMAIVVFAPWTDDRPLQKHFTPIGEQRTIALADGGVVTLNTGGQLVVDYSASGRRILLERGEAYFEVAEDPKRPFTVDLGTHAVTAIGTVFNVRKDPQRYQVAVIEGAVALHQVNEPVTAMPPPVSIRGAGPRRVEAGWVAELDLSRNELKSFQPESMDSYGDWRSGLLSFFHEPLSQVVQELNRYSRKKILIEDASVMEMRVVTAVRVTDIGAALRGLEHALPIEVTRHYDRIVIAASAADGNTPRTGKDDNGHKP